MRFFLVACRVAALRAPQTPLRASRSPPTKSRDDEADVPASRNRGCAVVAGLRAADHRQLLGRSEEVDLAEWEQVPVALGHVVVVLDPQLEQPLQIDEREAA